MVVGDSGGHIRTLGMVERVVMWEVFLGVVTSTWQGKRLLFGAEFMLGMATILSKPEIKTYGLTVGRTLETGTDLGHLVQYSVGSNRQ